MSRRRVPFALVAAAFALAVVPRAARAAEGELDPSFWTDGRLELGGTLDYQVTAVLAAPDGRAVVVGTRDPGDGADEWFWRAVGDGSTSAACPFFPPGGATRGNAGAAAFDLAGNLLVAGSARYGGADRLAAARFSYPSCALDPTFDGDGYWTLDIPGGAPDQVRAIAVDSANSIAFGAYVNTAVGNDLVVVRLTGAGATMNGFSGDGWLTLDPSDAGLDDGLSGIAVDAQGRVVVGGWTSYGAGGENSDFIAARFEPDGDLDPTFDGDGLVRLPFDLVANGYDAAYGMAHDFDTGKLVLVGRAQTSGGSVIAVARLLANGAPDPQFSGDGKATNALGAVHSRLEDAVVDGLGRITAAGYREPGSNRDFVVVRYGADGVLDDGFGGDGWTTVAFDSGPGTFDVDDEGRALALQVGRIVVAGEVEYDADFHTHAGIARLDVALIFADGFGRGTTRGWSDAEGLPGP